MDYLIHIKSLRISAKTEFEAKRRAIKQIEKGFRFAEEMIDEIEEDEEQF